MLCALGFGAGGAAGCRCKVLLLECCARFWDWAPGRQHCICAGAAAGCCCPGAAVRMLRALNLGRSCLCGCCQNAATAGCCVLQNALCSSELECHCALLGVAAAGRRCKVLLSMRCVRFGAWVRCKVLCALGAGAPAGCHWVLLSRFYTCFGTWMLVPPQDAAIRVLCALWGLGAVRGAAVFWAPRPCRQVAVESV